MDGLARVREGFGPRPHPCCPFPAAPLPASPHPAPSPLPHTLPLLPPPLPSPPPSADTTVTSLAPAPPTLPPATARIPPTLPNPRRPSPTASPCSPSPRSRTLPTICKNPPHRHLPPLPGSIESNNGDMRQATPAQLPVTEPPMPPPPSEEEVAAIVEAGVGKAKGKERQDRGRRHRRRGIATPLNPIGKVRRQGRPKVPPCNDDALCGINPA